jgi:hypothetical protein
MHQFVRWKINYCWASCADNNWSAIKYIDQLLTENTVSCQKRRNCHRRNYVNPGRMDGFYVATETYTKIEHLGNSIHSVCLPAVSRFQWRNTWVQRRGSSVGEPDSRVASSVVWRCRELGSVPDRDHNKLSVSVVRGASIGRPDFDYCQRHSEFSLYDGSGTLEAFYLIETVSPWLN